MLLEGISNWINNCLIPISRLDLPAQREEAASYGKESEREWEGGRERERVRDVERHKTDRGKATDHKGQCFLEIEEEIVARKNTRQVGKTNEERHRQKTAAVFIYVAIFRVKQTSSEWPPQPGGEAAAAASLQGAALTDPSR